MKEVVREQTGQIKRGSVFQMEGAASVKVLRSSVFAWHI